MSQNLAKHGLHEKLHIQDGKVDMKKYLKTGKINK